MRHTFLGPTPWTLSFLSPLSLLLLGLVVTSCSSSDKPSAKAKSEPSSPSNRSSASPAASSPPPAENPKPTSDGNRSANATWSVQYVTSTLGNESAIEGSVGQQVLTDAIIGLDETLKKEPDNAGLLVTYMGILRLYGQNPELYMNVERKAGSLAPKNPWYALEAGYGALRRREYSMAEYLFTRAEKNTSDPMAKKAVNHAWALRYLIQGKIQLGILRLRENLNGDPPYLPTLLTLGFLGLKAGDIAGAERMFRSAVAGYPNSLNAKLGLAAALHAGNKSAEAVGHIRQVYQSRSGDRRVVWNLALVLAESPATQKEAQDLLTKYFQLTGSIPEIDAKANALMNKLHSQTAQPGAGQAAPPAR